MPSAKILADEPRSLTPEPSNNTGTRTPRRSHVSIASSKRASMVAGLANSNKSSQGMFRRAVPQMPRALAFICFMLNLVLPGTGKNLMLSVKKKRYLMACHFICHNNYDTCRRFDIRNCCLQVDS